MALRASHPGLACGRRPLKPAPAIIRRKSAQLVRPKCEAAASDKPSAANVKVEGASTNVAVLYQRMVQLAMPYWTDPVVGGSARWKLAGVVGLTLATTGVSVAFNFLGRDFFNALSEKNEELFGLQLIKYLGAFVVGIPVFVFKGYYQSTLALEWRAWLTEKLLEDYFAGRTFYSLQAQAAVDNPDQRIQSDAAAFTATALNLALILLNATIDLVSFSGILYSIYPPLFAALLAYSVSGTALSVVIGKPLVGLNFAQEAREADLRYGLVRVRENAEAVAFYRGEEDEKALLQERLKAAVSNYLGLLIASRNLDFFTSFYRYLIQLLPAAVVAPLFFQGKIEFGVINQSQSAFNHVLNDMSLVVYQFDNLAGFSAVIDRLGQFQEVMAKAKQPEHGASKAAADSTVKDQTPAPAGPSTDAGLASPSAPQWPGVKIQYLGAAATPTTSSSHSTGHAVTPGLPGGALLQLSSLSVVTPDGRNLLVKDLDLLLSPGSSLLLMGPSGAGKTSILRTLAGLWALGAGQVSVACAPAQVMFLPQKPYMVLGSLRDQVLYPTYAVAADKATQAMIDAESAGNELPSATASSSPVSSDSAAPSHMTDNQAATASASTPAAATNGANKLPPPSDDEIVAVLRKVRLGHLLSRYAPAGEGSALDAQVDWAASLSLGEQQRVAWARLLLAKPLLALMDEATSALDQATEEELYQLLVDSKLTYVSVGHRMTLKRFHSQLLQLAPQPTDPTPTSNSSGPTSATMSWELVVERS